MGRRRTLDTTNGRQAYRVLMLSAGPESGLGIVNTTMLNGLLSMIPDEILAKFIESQSRQAPPFEDPNFSGWVKACRTTTGLTQLQFAEELRRKGLKLCESDIGNLENGLRKEGYGLKRRTEITETIQSLMQEAQLPRPR